MDGNLFMDWSLVRLQVWMVHLQSILLCEDDGDGVVEDALAKHKHVEYGVYVESIEDGNGSYRVHSWD